MASNTSRSRLIVVLLLVECALVIGASSAFAHSHPVASDPAPNATVHSPAAITMHFSEALEPKFSSIKVVDANGNQVNSAPSQVDSSDTKLMTVSLPVLKPGSYTVHWVSVAADGHRLQESYKFTVK